jgi:hypothetical protein
MKKILLTLVVALAALAATARTSPYVNVNNSHYAVKNIPSGYGVRYFVKDRDDKTYYIVLRPIKAWHDDNSSRVFYGTQDSLQEVPVTGIKNSYRVVEITVAINKLPVILNFPPHDDTYYHQPWIGEEALIDNGDGDIEEDSMHAEHNLTWLKNEG